VTGRARDFQPAQPEVSLEFARSTRLSFRFERFKESPKNICVPSSDGPRQERRDLRCRAGKRARIRRGRSPSTRAVDESEGRGMADFHRGTWRPANVAGLHPWPNGTMSSAPRRFGGREVVAIANTAALMHNSLPALGGRTRPRRLLVVGQLAWPTRTFTGEYRLDLAGVPCAFTPPRAQSGSRQPVGGGPRCCSRRRGRNGNRAAESMRAMAGCWKATCGTGENDFRPARAGHGPFYPARPPFVRGSGKQTIWRRLRTRIRELVAEEGCSPPFLKKVTYASSSATAFPSDRHDMLRRHRRTAGKSSGRGTRWRRRFRRREGANRQPAFGSQPSRIGSRTYAGAPVEQGTGGVLVR